MKTECHTNLWSWPTPSAHGARDALDARVAARRRHPSGPGEKESPAKPAARHASIRLVRRIAASQQRVFRAWLDPQIAGRWLFATATHPMIGIDIDARAGGSFCLTDGRYGESFEYRGDYLQIVPWRRLAFTLSTPEHRDAITRVTVDLVPRRNGCALAVTHEAVPLERATITRQRWAGMLHGLALTLDSP